MSRQKARSLHAILSDFENSKIAEAPIAPAPKIEMGKKHDSQKPRFSLLPSSPLWQVVAVLEFGAGKYGADNWRNVPNAKERYFNACHRHLNAWWCGETVDAESGLPHLAHAVCCLMFLMVFDLNDKKL